MNLGFKEANPVIIPSCSLWFDSNGIHEIERDSLPEFFVGKTTKTPAQYKKWRNRIIELYRENPKVYLTATVCRRHISADACALVRVHSFLEHWGLINFSFDPNNHDFTHARNFYQSNMCSAEAKLDMLLKAKHLIQNSDSVDDPYFHTFASITRRVRPRCDSCGYFCSRTWYIRPSPLVDEGHEQIYEREAKTVTLCSSCFELKKYPRIFDSSSFERYTLAELLKSLNHGSKPKAL